MFRIDASQDYSLTRAVSEGGLEILEFYRHFDTCDSHDYAIDVSNANSKKLVNDAHL